MCFPQPFFGDFLPCFPWCFDFLSFSGLSSNGLNSSKPGIGVGIGSGYGGEGIGINGEVLDSVGSRI